MNKPENCIPKDKHDIESIKKLSDFEYPYYKSILPSLFEWIQDINWPVAQKIVPLLLKAGIDTVPHIKHILQTDDYVWQYWTITFVIDKFEDNIKKKIVEELYLDLERLAYNPIDEEKKEELDVVAKAVLINKSLD